MNFIYSHRYNNYGLGHVHVFDSKGEERELDDCIKEKGKMLACRFIEGQCKDCISHVISKTIHFSEIIGSDKVIFLGSYRINRSLVVQKKQYGIDEMNVYNVFDIHFPLEDEITDKPYFFLIDNKLNVSNVFIPDVYNPDITDEYFEIIKKYLDDE
jgi:hypothetical protein